jgi:hypothetical protein
MNKEEPETKEDNDELINMAEKFTKNADLMMEQVKKVNPEILQVEQKDIEFNILSHATLISIINDLQHIGIEGKNPKKVLKELKKIRKSRNI